MKFSETLVSVGSPISFYAKLTNITGSTLATLFLCQFYYWTGKQKDRDGWIYKTQAEIQDETGLKRREQEQARKQLKKLGFMQERYKGIPRRLEFRVCFDAIDAHWTLFTHTGTSQAIQANTEKANRKASTLPKINTVQNGQYSASELDSIGCPKWTDNLYTQITLKDYFSKITLEDKADGAIASSTLPVLKKDNPFNHSNPQELVPSSDQQINEAHRGNELSKGKILPRNFTSKEKPRLRYSDGWFQFPKSGRNKLPGALALRTMQWEILIEYGSGYFQFELATDEQSGRIYDPRDGWYEDEEFYFTHKMPLQKMIDLRDTSDDIEWFDKTWFNERALYWFEFWRYNCERMDGHTIQSKSVAVWLQDKLGITWEETG